ncbi:MAG TPA: hypothetical protein VFZ22_15430 [Pyrinomonadaceae bacterium]|nr:hypothetical protein [Pyrinomonadaceae bacterium]
MIFLCKASFALVLAIGVAHAQDSTVESGKVTQGRLYECAKLWELVGFTN